MKVMKDTWSEDLTEIRSLLQELVGNLQRAERYFEFYEITENHKLYLASCYLDETALQVLSMAF
ncbi:hypothetical protein KY289_007887 [Solanum tuberosum]|nr:hypothetical protein KY289_007887 [Solanum tuberosum]KAH0714724.1 hypothetical protein KY284_007629 [Solanum tuberosum]